MKTVHRFLGAFIFAAMLFQSQTAEAGMPMPVLTRYGIERLIGISTALFILMVVAAVPIMFCWNALFTDTKSNKPTSENDAEQEKSGSENAGMFQPLTYPKALGVTFLGGCLFLLVLVMIAGSRELLSPGAWIPDGAMSKTLFSVERNRIAQSSGSDEQKGIDILRREAIVRLRDALMLYAKEHNGRLPDSIKQSQFGDLWQIPFAGGIQYEYFPTDDSLPLAREPEMLPEAKFSLGRKFEITEAAK